jgi:hypothetical protein
MIKNFKDLFFENYKKRPIFTDLKNKNTIKDILQNIIHHYDNKIEELNSYLKK